MLIRAATHLSAMIVSCLLSALVTVAMLSAQWALSILSDSAVLVFELLVAVIALSLVRWLIQRADALAQQVGTVRRGSPQESQADRVLARFSVAENTLNSLWVAFSLPAIAGFFLLDSRIAMSVHGVLLVLAISGAVVLGNRLDTLRNLRGYAVHFGRRAP
ncbi:hypothetical protein [Kosakonia pseudosacchari]|uniref:Uncharacterized protein n=1 Tax=Kosakonia pseudosacchari TaxID=1646340 RepID=A0ABX4IKX8_9ENTR|nr:hypothetical protein [Kosakonia pseudosacchari]PDO83589.1 hypothetical protein BK796_19580 [Kosakonia pseudosacchari]QOV64593.1 hypothetical protein IP581_02655 [Kosakonia pseudosacchari]